MSCSECVIYENISEGSKLLGESFAVLCLFLAITSILKKNDIAVLHSCDSCLCVLADNIVIRCELDFLSEKLGETYSDRRKRKLRLRLALRLSEVAAEDDLAAVSDQLLDCRKRCNEAVLVCDLAGLQRNVEVAAAKYALALYIDIINRFFVKHWNQSSFYILTIVS